ncbi:MAG: putative type II secretion system protein HxcR [Syntrophomonadaceae bacterium]|nr:putative type II secretion system protein HxcR [Bacillota bacterium]
MTEHTVISAGAEQAHAKGGVRLLANELAKGAGMSVIKLVDALVECAYCSRASDIHLDPREDGVAIRLRIDGVLQDVDTFPSSVHNEVISRLKILCGLRTDEHQAAQDGRFKLSLEDGASVDVRTSIVPTYYGENAVLRILSDQAEEFTLDSLGFTPENREKIESAIRKPHGMILATGPAGSGKTTTLYTLVKMLNVPEVSIITIEDPIEYSVSGINQIQVNARTGLTFANGLRSMLRQDPNIIMVGEIRDADTAGLAVNTSLTGHLVLSTLHTNDAPTTLPRLLDMKVEPYLIASTVNIAIGQRLVRKICGHCKEKKKNTEAEEKSLLEIMPHEMLAAHTTFYSGAGCNRCGGTGYSGRAGLHEVMVIDAPIREAILRKASASEIRKIAFAQGMKSLVADGFYKAAAGVTTIEEVLRMRYE